MGRHLRAPGLTPLLGWSRKLSHRSQDRYNDESLEAVREASADVRESSLADVALDRLEDQLGWYARKAAANRRGYQSLKVVQIVTAAAIPIAAAAEESAALAGILGAVQQLFQFQQNWISYRATAEGLKHEKYLYLARAGPYASSERPHASLAEAVEARVSQETSEWPQC